MKIAVYAISKNEEKFVKRFMASIKNEADVVIVADTGSSDQTVKLLEEEGAIVHSITVDPWRFDVARNISLSFVPADVDVCVCIDLDEVLTAGWRKAIEDCWTSESTRVRYQYVWNVLPNGDPGTTFWYDKIHRREGFRWVKPVHEVLEYDGVENHVYTKEITLWHFPDSSKSRSNYLPLLELACREDPTDDRSSHYLGREYMYYSRFDQAIEELKRHLNLPSATWNAERSASMRYISKCYQSKHDYSNAVSWGLRACAEAPLERETWIQLAKVYYDLQRWTGVLFAMSQALDISERPKTYICEPESWGSAPYDYASIAAWNLGMKDRAILLCKEALKLSPSDARLQNNLLHMEGKLQ